MIITTIIKAGFQPENAKKPLRILLCDGLSLCPDAPKARKQLDSVHKKRTMKFYQFHSSYLAEAVGFEPTGPVRGLPDFESGPL